MSTEPVQHSHSPGTIYRCAQDGHGHTVTWPATSGLPATTHCFRCHHQWATEDPAQNGTGELIPGYEGEAWDDPVAHAWKTPITFRETVLTVYTGSVSGRTSEEVRSYLQHEYRAAQIGTPEVAR